MTEPDNNLPPPPPIHPGIPPPPPPPPAPGQPEVSLREELVRLRSGNKTLKIIMGVLVMLFVLIAGAGYVVYQKVTAMTAPLTEAFKAFPPPPAADYQAESQLPSMKGPGPASSMPASSLGMLVAGQPGGGPGAGQGAAPDPETAKRIAASINKYMQRPVVREFLADLQKDPDVAAAMAKGKAGNPMAIFAAARNSKNINQLMMKYATRPDFIKTMMEISNDPDFKTMTGAMQGIRMPQPPARQARPVQAPSSGSLDEEADDEAMDFDQSAVSGAPSAPVSVRKKAPPNPPLR